MVYGDLGTSPLYVFYNTFPRGVRDPEDVIGALSLIIYSLALIPLLKYVFIVCKANDNGQGKLIPCCYLTSLKSAFVEPYRTDSVNSKHDSVTVFEWGF